MKLRGTRKKAEHDLRLSPYVRPEHYRVHVEPDLEKGTYRGHVEIDLRVERPVSSIELHAVDLDLRRPRFSAEGYEEEPAVVTHPERQTVEFRLRHRVLAGPAKLVVEFEGKLRRDLRGLYAASQDGRRYAFTQLEATDARRFFPCFDEPSFKARFTFTVATEEKNAVVSNSPVASVEHLEGGRKLVSFETTPKLSTYLCALAVGELEASEEKRVGPTPIRVWHVPGKGHLCDFALEAAAESLSRLEEYFGLPYPYAKLDLVAVPDFEAGAMENAGAVFFRETLLLVDPATVSLAEKKRVAEVVAHELAHMWYGDLVTMAWWNDLWLNEAFATWMAFRVVDEWKPEWRMWNNFEHHRASALGLDALANTHPIYAEVRDPAEATENFDAITYEKGASVVRMIEHYLGADAFRRGVRIYIRRHQESNAEARDLWTALEEASGQKVEKIVRPWIEQAGYPLVRLEYKREGKRAFLSLRQQRFFARPRARITRELWPVPLVVKVGSRRGVRLERELLARRTGRLVLGEAGDVEWCYGNASEGGFYRPLHDAKMLAKLSERLLEALTPVERMGLLGHQWAALRAGHVRIDSFLDLADRLGEETDYDVLEALLGPLGFLEDQLLDAAGKNARPAFRNWLLRRFGPAWSTHGWDARPDEKDEQRLRRAALLRLVGILAEDRTVAGEAQKRFRAYLRDRKTLEPNLADPLVAIVAREGGADEYEAFRKAARKADTPQERRRFQLALAEFRKPSLVRKTLSLLLTEEVATQDVGLVLVRLFGNRAARERTWQFLKKRWEDVSRRLPPMMVSRVVDATPALGSLRYKREVASFFRSHPVPTATRALKQALERFDLNHELRRRVARDLGRWLERASSGSTHSQSGTR